ncbi:N-6 DNA methylase [Variovorax sp. W2I14]|uniref:N-6 DNA methylase n=1 Tax=Variovorax sp. W2I14 TaxID=3042290 RepID=UPI003D23BBE7
MTLDKEFYRIIENVARKAKHTSSKQQVFKDVIQIGFNSVIQGMKYHPYQAKWHPSLFVEMAPYKVQPELFNELGRAVVMWFSAIKDSAPFTDVLGSSYDEHLGHELGQFLTPPDLAALLAQLIFTDDNLESKFKAGEAITVGDDMGCGAGSLLLAWLKASSERFGPAALERVFVVARDMDPSMVQLTAVQIFHSAVFHNVALGGLQVQWGNALLEPSSQAGYQAVFDPDMVEIAVATLRAHHHRRGQQKAMDAIGKRLAVGV